MQLYTMYIIEMKSQEQERKYLKTITIIQMRRKEDLK